MSTRDGAVHALKQDMTLTETTLGEICESGGGEIQTGPFGSQLHKSDYQEKGTPVVMPSDIVEGSISTDDVARVGDDMVAKLSSHQLKATLSSDDAATLAAAPLSRTIRKAGCAERAACE
jgi:hypothetical protein